METEPTEEKRQRQAFAFLRDHARNAHIAGDGLQVDLLCHTGLQRISQLAKETKLLLPLSEIAWMPIFALYWLVDPSERYAVEQALKGMESRSDEDRLVAEWMIRYHCLVEQPLAGDLQLSPALQEFAWPNSFAERTPEVEALVTHLVELVWFHDPGEGRWKRLADAWLQVAPAWTHASLVALKARLELQARLTVPDKAHVLFPEGDAEKLRAHYDLAELWLLHLQGRSSAVCKAAERLTPTVSAESHRWRALHDFIHFDSAYEPHEDSQGVRLARRRRLSMETPLLIFHDERGERMANTLGELFRARSEGAASKRWEVFLLARLHELAALRLWDYGMWLEAIRAQAQANLEVVQWTDAYPEIAAQGLEQAVRSCCVKSPDKDAGVRRAIDILEFAPSQVLTRFAAALLATYPRQKHQALELLDDITDLLPQEVWPELARWTLTYSQESSEQRTNGWKAAPATHWVWVMPVLAAESSVWATLQPEVLAMARWSHSWMGDSGAFLRRWLLFAPQSYSREVGETMASHPEISATECFSRAECLIEFEEWNPSLRGVYTRRLLPTAQSASEALILARHLNENDLAQREEILRERIAQKMREEIAQATLQAGEKGFNFSPTMNVHLVKQWRVEDRPLLEELIVAVNSPDVVTECLTSLLSSIQLLVAHGPVEFAEVAQPHVSEWVRHVPRGRKMMGTESGPLSIIQWNTGGEGDIALILGWLAFQLPRKLGSASNVVVLTWVRQVLLLGEIRPLDLAIYGSAVVALQTPPATSAEPLALMETAILSLWGRAAHNIGAMQSLAKALNKMASLVASEQFGDRSAADALDAADTFVTVLSRFVPRFAKSPRAALRAAVASLVWQLKRRGSHETWVSDALAALQCDHRARVRFEAHGGWGEARIRADLRSGM